MTISLFHFNWVRIKKDRNQEYMPELLLNIEIHFLKTMFCESQTGLKFSVFKDDLELLMLSPLPSLCWAIPNLCRMRLYPECHGQALHTTSLGQHFCKEKNSPSFTKAKMLHCEHGFDQISSNPKYVLNLSNFYEKTVAYNLMIISQIWHTYKK